MSGSTFITAAWVIPVTAPPLRDGCVEVAGARIVSVGSAPAARPAGTNVIDLGAAALMPGLVNPHTHLELGCYAGLLKPAPLWQWLARLVALRAVPGQLPRERAAVAEGARCSLRAGVTCVGDISRRNIAWSVLKTLPIRKVCFVELLALADHPPRNLDELRAAVAGVAEDELLTVGISPHAPYSVPAEQVRGAVALAAELGRPWTMHVAETEQEIAFLEGRSGALGRVFEKLLGQCGVCSPRQSPIEYLERCTGGLRRGALAHMNYVADGELARLAGLGHTVVYCPRAHHFFGHGAHPFLKLRAAGVRVALGTDSLASNSSLSLLDELHFVHTQVPGAPPPPELLRMATLEAAAALDLADRIGSLEPGKQADLAAFPCPRHVTDPVRHVVENPAAACAVWVAGRRFI